MCPHPDRPAIHSRTVLLIGDQLHGCVPLPTSLFFSFLYSVSILFQSIHSTAVPGRFNIHCTAAQQSQYALHSCPANNLSTRLSSYPPVLTCPAWTVPIPRLSEYIFRSCPALSEITPWLFLYPLHGCPSYPLFTPELSQYPLCSCPVCPLSTPQLSQYSLYSCPGIHSSAVPFIFCPLQAVPVYTPQLSQ